MKAFLIILLIVLGIGVILYIFSWESLEDLRLEKADLEETLSQLEKNRTLMSIKPLEISPNKTQVEISFIDQDNQKAGEPFTLTFDNNSELFFDFLIYRMDSIPESASMDVFPVLVFPYRVYNATMKPEDGILLENHLIEAGFPIIYNGRGLTEDQKYHLKIFYEALVKKEYPPEVEALQWLQNYVDGYGNGVHNPKGVEMKTDYIYYIKQNYNGTLEMTKEMD